MRSGTGGTGRGVSARTAARGSVEVSTLPRCRLMFRARSVTTAPSHTATGELARSLRQGREAEPGRRDGLQMNCRAERPTPLRTQWEIICIVATGAAMR
jgi:hypothetical protein